VLKAGNFRLSEEQRQELVTRAEPLMELKGIVKCAGIEKSYFVVTGSLSHPYFRDSSGDPALKSLAGPHRCEGGGQEHAGADGLLRGNGTHQRVLCPLVRFAALSEKACYRLKVISSCRLTSGPSFTRVWSL
jgi:hypothetical protein